MKIKTSELTGSALDWAVAKCEAVDEIGIHTGVVVITNPDHHSYGCFRPSIAWSQGGPIIEREKIRLTPRSPEREAAFGSPAWVAGIYDKTTIHSNLCEHPTALIAAMRCYVASKLGDEVDIPEELA